MTDLNYVCEIGRLTRDAELKYTTNGTAKASFALAVNRSIKQNNQWTERASFFDVILWGKSAENLNQYLVKGKQVAVTGYLDQERWTAPDGSNKSRVVIVAGDVQLLGGKGDETQAAAKPLPSMYTTPEQGGEFPEEIPF